MPFSKILLPMAPEEPDGIVRQNELEPYMAVS